MSRTAVTLAAVRPLPRLPLRDAALLQVLEACAHPLPTFPYTHTQVTTQPLVGILQEAAHIGIPKVGHPPSDGLGQYLLAPLITDVPTARGQLFEPFTQLGFRLRMDAQASLSLSCVEGVAEVLLSVHAAYVGLLAIHLQKEFLLNETTDALAYPLGCSWTFAENNAIVGIADKRQTTTVKFTVKLIEHYVAQYRT